MQREVAKKLGLNANAGNAEGGEDAKAGGEVKESPADIMQKLWTVENLLTVETEWFRSVFSPCFLHVFDALFNCSVLKLSGTVYDERQVWFQVPVMDNRFVQAAWHAYHTQHKNGICPAENWIGEKHQHPLMRWDMCASLVQVKMQNRPRPSVKKAGWEPGRIHYHSNATTAPSHKSSSSLSAML